MKTFIILGLFLTGCHRYEPKYVVDQKLMITEGFFKDKVLTLESYRISTCWRNGCNNTEIVYTGDIFTFEGHKDVQVCEGDLAVIPK